MQATWQLLGWCNVVPWRQLQLRPLQRRPLQARQLVGLALSAASLALLVPGVMLPMLSLRISASFPFVGRVDLYNQTQSISESIRSLLDSGHTAIAVLIFVFSLAVPLIKLVLVFTSLLAPPRLTQVFDRTVNTIGKWSMADVFAVAIFMAFLAGQAHPNSEAQLHSGFYCFLGYCVSSLLGSQLLASGPTGVEPSRSILP